MDDKKFKKIVVLGIVITFIIASVAVPNIKIFSENENSHIVSASGILSEPPYTPSKPSGNTSGLICMSYNYSTSTEDPGGLNITYGWDWDGDLAVDEWTEEYESNETCIISHIWTEPGDYEVSVIANNSLGNLSEWSESLNVLMENLPPNVPSDPEPRDGAQETAVDLTLTWTGDDPNTCDTITYDLYFGTSDNPPKVESNLTDASYTPDQLDLETMYYWKIVSWDNHNESTEGLVWSFETRGNNPPQQPHTPTPSNESTDVDITTDLSWVCIDFDGDEVTFDVYLSKDTPPDELVSSGQEETTYDHPSDLEEGTTYYWKIIAEDEFGATREGPIWHFTTKSSSVITVNITKPIANKFHLRGIVLPALFNTIVYGPIKIEANVSSELEVEKVEFYVDGKKIGEDDTAPYTKRWAPIQCGTYEIGVIAYDVTNKTASDNITVIKWRAHPGVLLAAGGLFVIKQKILPTKRTYVRGTVINLRRVGKTYHCRAVRLHYTEFAGLTRTSGVIKLQRVSFKHGPLLRKYDIGPLGLTTYIAGVIPGGII
jgi:hypothetical protein